MYGALNISTGGMIAQRTRLEVISNNIANVSSLTNAKGEYDPYRRHFTLMSAGDGSGGLGVSVKEIAIDDAPFEKVFDPEHPYAAKETDPSRDLVKGYVNYPNVDTTIELMDGYDAQRAYEANVTAAEASKAMFEAALQLIA